MKLVELRKKEGSSLLLLCIAVLGAESTTNPCMRLCLRRRTSLLTAVFGEKLGVDVTEEQKCRR